jgi:hypothetical protein
MTKETTDLRVLKGLSELDAYGHLTWCVGFNSEEGDWLACFDFDVIRDEDGKRWVVYQTTVNSDSGGFIDTPESCIVEIDSAPFDLPYYWMWISLDGHGEQWTDEEIAEAAKINEKWNLALQDSVDHPDGDTIYCDESCEGCEICHEAPDPVADGWVGSDGLP